MSKPSVLIVGAGALGMATGFHLSLAGAGITYLVRSGRKAALPNPQMLYCYDDQQLKSFADFQTVDSVADAVAEQYDFVLITFDGATSRGEEAAALLKSLGDGVRSTTANVLVCGVGVYDYTRQVMALPEERVMEGTMAMLSYQTNRVTLPLNPPTDPQQLAAATIAYKHMGNNPGFMIADKPSEPVRKFADLYNSCGVSKCNVVNSTVYKMLTSSIFPIMAIFDLAGWPDAATLAKDRGLMSLGAKAMSEIMALPQYGWRGKLAALAVNRFTLARMNAGMEKSCMPVDYSAFNKFHHGGKVRQQDILVMQQSLQSGKSRGKPMTALNALLDRYEAHCVSD